MQDDHESHTPTQVHANAPGGASTSGSANATEASLRPKLNRRDIVHLILATYRTTFPYVLLFVLVILIVTWLLTEFAFGP